MTGERVAAKQKAPGSLPRPLQNCADYAAQIEPLIQSSSCFFCTSAPTRWAATLPSLKIISVGMAWMRYFCVMAGFWIDVDLDHLHLALHLGGDLLQRRRHGLARPAPLGEEIDEHGLGRLQHVLLEVASETKTVALLMALRSPWLARPGGRGTRVGRNVGRPPSGVKARGVELPEAAVDRRRAVAAEFP